jgi:hypothetical protein
VPQWRPKGSERLLQLMKLRTEPGLEQWMISTDEDSNR